MFSRRVSIETEHEHEMVCCLFATNTQWTRRRRNAAMSAHPATGVLDDDSIVVVCRTNIGTELMNYAASARAHH